MAKSNKKYPFDVVTGEWIRYNIAKLGITRGEVCGFLNISDGNLSEYMTGNKKLSNIRKSAFYYFFQAYSDKIEIPDYSLVNNQWLKDLIRNLKITTTDFGYLFGNQRGEISQFCNGKKQMSKVRKVAFYMYSQKKSSIYSNTTCLVY